MHSPLQQYYSIVNYHLYVASHLTGHSGKRLEAYIYTLKPSPLYEIPCIDTNYISTICGVTTKDQHNNFSFTLHIQGASFMLRLPTLKLNYTLTISMEAQLDISSLFTTNWYSIDGWHTSRQIASSIRHHTITPALEHYLEESMIIATKIQARLKTVIHTISWRASILFLCTSYHHFWQLFNHATVMYQTALHNESLLHGYGIAKRNNCINASFQSQD